MNHQEIINEISKQKSEYNYQSQAEDLANSLETISDDIYSESERFIYELIQNADDASHFNQKDLEITIDFTEEFAIISHNGVEFSKEDIMAISSVGKSQKSEKPNQTGYKGIGFKSVFGKSDSVYVYSNNFCFCYDRNHWSSHEHKMPWQIIPLWREIPQELRDTNFGKLPVSTAIRFNPKKGFSRQILTQTLVNLFSNSQIMLFLRNVMVINVGNDFTIRKTKTLIAAKQLSGNESFVLSSVSLSTNTNTTNWVVGDFIGIEIDDSTRNALRQDEKAPKRLKETQFTNISFAGMIKDNGELVELKENSLIFTYLPTKINKGFPFLINADFLTNAPREGFHEDRIWNIWLFEMVAYKSFEWLRELAQTEHKYQMPRIIPDKFNSEKPMEKSFNLGFNNAVKDIEFIPNENDRLLKACETLINKTDIDEVIKSEILTDYYNSSNKTFFSNESLANKKIKSISNLTKIGVKTFEVRELNGLFNSEIFQERFDIKQNFTLIKFLYEKSNSEKKSEFWRELIPDLKFIFNESEVLCSPNTPIYFPIADFESELSHSFDFIHNDVLEEVNKNAKIKDWFIEIGICEPLPKSIIKNTIGKHISALTEENSIETVRYLFKNKEQIEDYSTFGNMMILTTKGALKSAKGCYLSNFYNPELAIEDQLSDDLFVSSEYVEIGESIKEWNLFFTKLGVLENFIWVTNRPNFYDKSRYDYLYFRLKTGFPNGVYPNLIDQYEVYLIAFVEKCIDDHKFSKFYWNVLFKAGLPNRVGLDKGHCWYFKWASLNIVPYFDWLIQNVALFPTKKGTCDKSSSIIINRSDFKKIGGSTLPVLDLDIELPKDIENDTSIYNFRKSIELPEYLEVLEAISCQYDQDNANIAETTDRIGLIYHALLNFSRSHEREVLESWGKGNKLLSTYNEFIECNKLHYLDIEGFKTPQEVKGFVKIPNAVKHSNGLVEFLMLLGVKIINQNSLNTKSENAIIETELRMRLLSRVSLIALVVSVKENRLYSNVVEELLSVVARSNFFKSQKIYLDCTVDGNQVFTIERTALAEANQFSYIGNWYSPITLYDLTSELCKFFSINDISKELNVLLLISFEEGLKWLESQNYDISIVPLPVVETEQVYAGDFRTEAQKAYSDTIGEITEKFVFDTLIKAYKTKYSLENVQVNNPSTFKTHSVEITWHRAAGNRYSNRDITVIENGFEKYFEVKSTVEKESVDNVLFWSFNEWSLMKESKNRYFMARVFNGSNPQEVTFVKMDVTQTDEF